VLSLVAWTAGCEGGEGNAPPALSETEIQHLEALGYADWAEESAAKGRADGTAPSSQPTEILSWRVRWGEERNAGNTCYGSPSTALPCGVSTCLPTTT
jgi:hypothetical protein